jgi:hypothetical protein
MSLTEIELDNRQDNDYMVTISLPAHVLPIRIDKAKSSNSCQIRNSDAAAAALPAQQLISPISSSQNVAQHGLSQTPQKKKERFYVVTSGRRTGVFEDW